MRCFSCKQLHTKSEYHLKDKFGCPICNNKIIVAGVNDVLTTDPWIKGFLSDENIKKARALSRGNNTVFLEIKCENCGLNKTKTLNDLTRKGAGCFCSRRSFGEELVSFILKENNITYKEEYIFPNSRRRYDFYLPETHTVIEVHGVQHYQEQTYFILGLEEQQKVDNNKREFVENKGINYLELDMRDNITQVVNLLCRELKINSDIDFSQMTFPKNEKFQSFVRELQLGSSKVKIQDCLEISETTYYNYKKRAVHLGLICENTKQKQQNYSQVVCLNTLLIFNRMSLAASVLKCHSKGISNNCRGKTKSAGKHPITGEKLKWMYYEDYVEKYGTEGLTEYVEGEKHT